VTKPIVRIVKVNNTWGHVVTDDFGALEALYKRFSIPVDNYWFMPKYKAGIWDGKIHFISDNGRFYNGILDKVLHFFGDEYEIELDEGYSKGFTDITKLKQEFITHTDNTLTALDPYPYQWRGAMKALYHKRGICEHGTGSGKSYTITMVVNYLRHKDINHKFLIMVPKLDLVEQFYEDMIKYGIPESCLGKYTGHQKDTQQQIIISTWQSCYKNSFLLKLFTVFIADECLHPDTNITMADGSKKKIKHIKKGDSVLTVNEKTGCMEKKRVIDIYHNMSSGNDLYEIEMKNGDIIKITGNHKVMLSDGSWKRVDELNGTEDLQCHELKADINILHDSNKSKSLCKP
jgi:hypothetical protein